MSESFRAHLNQIRRQLDAIRGCHDNHECAIATLLVCQMVISAYRMAVQRGISIPEVTVQIRSMIENEKGSQPLPHTTVIAVFDMTRTAEGLLGSTPQPTAVG